MSRLVRLGVSACVTAGALSLISCGGDDSAPTRNATTVISTVTVGPTRQTDRSPAPEPTPRTTDSRPAPTRSTADDAPTVVQKYVAAINAHDYRLAWELGGKNLADSYADFEAGFADTVHDTVRILGVNGSTVSVRLEALQTGGSLRIFEGTYTVRGGVIIGADVHEVPVPEPRPASPYYENCDEARAAGVAPLHEGDPGYAPHLDRDGDGVACEPYPP